MPDLKRLDVLAQVHSVRAESNPSRLLVFDLGLEVLGDEQLCILNAWSKVILGDACVAEGPLLQVFSALVYPTVVGGVHPISATVRAPLTAEALNVVEQRRAGGDLGYQISFSVAAIPVKETLLQQPQYGLPQTVFFRDRHNNGGVKGTIAQSDWVQLLRQLNWNEARLVEMPVSVAQNEFPIAYRHLEEAHDHFRRGHWPETMGACRKVAESVAGKLGGYSDKGANPQSLRQAVGPGPKGDRLNDIARELGQFLHLGRHDSNVIITRYDALLALELTTALFTYWCRPKSVDLPE